MENGFAEIVRNYVNSLNNNQFNAAFLDIYQNMQMMSSTPSTCRVPYITSGALDLCVRKEIPPPSPPNYPCERINNNNNYSNSPFDQYRNTVCSSDSETSSDHSTIPTPPSSNSLNRYPLTTAPIKTPRPFKAYPKDPINLTYQNIPADDANLLNYSDEDFTQFRERILSRVQSTIVGTNKNMRRVPQNNSHQRIDDPTYWEKRRKNNEAAKRSRDLRRAKEDEIAIRCAFLERENIQLKIRMAALESEKRRLQEIMYCK